MESLLEQVKEGYILSVEEKSRGAYPDFDAAKAAAAHFADATHRPSLHFIDYTVHQPHPL